VNSAEDDANLSDNDPAGGSGYYASQERIAVPRVLNGLLESGLLRSQPGGRLRMAHPVLLGYLAAGADTQPEQIQSLLNQPDWLGKSLAARYLAMRVDLSDWLEQIAPPPDIDTLQSGLLETARWLREMPERLAMRADLLRRLAAILQNGELALELRARSLAAIAATGSPQMGILFRKLLESPDEGSRRLAALGCGALQDLKAAPILENLLGDPSWQVRRAACLALVATGSQPALEATAASLLHGDDELRKAAAEALANHPEEGYPVLEEASALPDLLVRRAAVAGLGRIRQPLVASKWAMEILQKLQLEDSQWVVQNAAAQALEEMIQTNARSPRPMPALTQTPWLIAYASELGMGVAPGKPAWDLLFKALQSGSLEQRLAALEVLKRHGKENAILPLYDIYFAGNGEVREAAYQTLWHLRTAGTPLPAPRKFGVA
ncbi:MAG TPA: HEAT repeat domain-containing protein, partial [Anaerolineales bacterium]|nr:HEAT repeat domain-containing protein [Anaerolineales bacterium]